MAMQKLPLALTIVAIFAKIAVFAKIAIFAMAICVIKMALTAGICITQDMYCLLSLNASICRTDGPVFVLNCRYLYNCR